MRESSHGVSYREYLADHLHLHHRQQDGENGSAKRPSFKKPHYSQPLFRTLRRRRPLAADESSDCAVSPGASQVSVNSNNIPSRRKRDHGRSEEADPEDRQNVLEVWFAGQHGDIGGGWKLSPGEDRRLSDIALMWMLREAQNAGMPFDPIRVKASRLFMHDPEPPLASLAVEAPVIHIKGQEVPSVSSPEQQTASMQEFACEVHRLSTQSRVHDWLRFGGGAGWLSVAAWRFMEFMPFKRMDLQPDGSWRAISWPLPRGETRDMSADCKVHHSVIKRMEADATYRPGNLIVGGGGRGVRKAAEKYGIGSWRVVHKHEDPIEEIHVKDHAQCLSTVNGHS